MERTPALRVLALPHITATIFEFVSDTRLRIQIARVCRLWYRVARRLHKRRNSQLPVWRTRVMPSVLDELRAYFASVRKHEVCEHLKVRNEYDDDEVTDCRYLSPLSDRLLPSQYGGYKHLCYSFDYRANLFCGEYRQLRFQDACAPFTGRVTNVGVRIKGHYGTPCVRITLSAMDNWPPYDLLKTEAKE